MLLAGAPIGSEKDLLHALTLILCANIDEEAWEEALIAYLRYEMVP